MSATLASEPTLQDLRQLLVGTKLLSGTQIDELLKTPRKPGESLVSSLVKSGAASEEKLLHALAECLHLGFTRLTDKEIDAVARQKVPDEGCFPVQRHADAGRQRHVDRGHQ